MLHTVEFTPENTLEIRQAASSHSHHRTTSSSSEGAPVELAAPHPPSPSLKASGLVLYFYAFGLKQLEANTIHINKITSELKGGETICLSNGLKRRSIKFTEAIQQAPVK